MHHIECSRSVFHLTVRWREGFLYYNYRTVLDPHYPLQPITLMMCEGEKYRERKKSEGGGGGGGGEEREREKEIGV